MSREGSQGFERPKDADLVRRFLHVQEAIQSVIPKQ